MDIKKILISLIALVFIGSFFVFTVDEREQAILFRLGEIKRTDFKPGLHFMVPVLNNVKKYETRLLTLDSEPERFLTIEKKDVIVDTFVRWRISNLNDFYRATKGDMRSAGILLYQKINDGLRSEFGKRTVQEVVAGERSALMDIVTANANAEATELGMIVVDVRTKRIDLPAEVSSSVYDRMRAERERVARDFRSRGAEAAERIRATADRERTVILAEAYRDSETLRGEGDAKSAEIYATAYSQDSEFYDFYRSLNAYEKSFGQDGDILLLEPDSDFFKYFKNPLGR